MNAEGRAFSDAKADTVGVGVVSAGRRQSTKASSTNSHSAMRMHEVYRHMAGRAWPHDCIAALRIVTNIYTPWTINTQHLLRVTKQLSTCFEARAPSEGSSTI